jgi:CheY-like chemotaxis protein
MGCPLQCGGAVTDFAPPSVPARTLALADDDAVQAELVSAWLEHRGFRVLRFGSGTELLHWASASADPVDGLVLDVDMPGLDGFQSYRALRALPAYAQVPAVFVSASTPAELAAENGAFIAKDGEMLDRLSRWLDDRVAGAA